MLSSLDSLHAVAIQLLDCAAVPDFALSVGEADLALSAATDTLPPPASTTVDQNHSQLMPDQHIPCRLGGLGGK